LSLNNAKGERGRHVGVGAVHRRFVEAGSGNPGLEAPGRFCVDEARRPQYGDEDLSTLDLAGRRVDHLHGVPGEVNEQPLAGDMHLAQREL
jgi:hypothetical protein